MDFTLEKATKKKIGYTEDPQRCDLCQHYEEVDDPFLDRSWIDQCTYSNLVTFKVKKHARCNKFQKRKK